MTAGALLFNLWLKPQWRRLQRARWEERSRMGILGFASLSFLGILYGIFKPILYNFVSAEMIGQVLVAKLVYVFLTILLIILLLSNILAMLGRFVLDDELETLMSTPLHPGALFRYKFWQASLSSGWMVLVLWLPLLFAMRQALEIDPGFILWGLICVLPLGLLASALSALLLLLILRFFPAGLLKRATAAAAAIFGCSLIILLRLVQPERLTNPENSASVSAFLDSLRIPEPFFNPATHAAMAVTQWNASPLDAAWALAGLAAVALLSWLVVEHFASSRFHHLWLKAREMQGHAGAKSSGMALKNSSWFSGGGVIQTLVTRQFLALLRHPANRIQIMFLGALISIFLYSMYKIPWDDSTELRSILFLLACLCSQLIVIAVGSRFFFPGPSMDAKTAWLELSAPLPLRAHLLARFVPAMVLLTALSLGLASCAAYLLRPPTDAFVVGLFIAFTSPLMASTLVVGLGICLASSRFKQPDQAVTSASGVMMTMVAFLAVFGAAGFVYWFSSAWYRAHLVIAGSTDYTAVMVFGLFWLGIFGASLSVPWILAKRKLEHWDL